MWGPPCYKKPLNSKFGLEYKPPPPPPPPYIFSRQYSRLIKVLRRLIKQELPEKTPRGGSHTIGQKIMKSLIPVKKFVSSVGTFFSSRMQFFPFLLYCSRCISQNQVTIDIGGFRFKFLFF